MSIHLTDCKDDAYMAGVLRNSPVLVERKDGSVVRLTFGPAANPYLVIHSEWGTMKVLSPRLEQKTFWLVRVVLLDGLEVSKEFETEEQRMEYIRMAEEKVPNAIVEKSERTVTVRSA